MNIHVDTETVGLNGHVKLIQYAIDNGPVQFIILFKGWQNSPETRAELVQFFSLIDRPAATFVGFNVAFDLFHLYRLQHQLSNYPLDSYERPVRPFRCKTLDLQVHAMMNSPLSPFAFNRAGARSVALVRRIPKVAQEYVADLVTSKLKGLIPQSFGLGVGVHQVAKNKELVTLSFKVEGRLSLKGLMREYGVPTINLADVWPLPDKGSEKPWLPYPDPIVHDPIEAQCDEIMKQPDHAFYKYAKLDIVYLQMLYEKLGRPKPDYNSACCHNQAYLRYYGLDIDRAELLKAESYYGSKVEEIERLIAGVNLRSSKERLELLQPHFPLIASTSKAVLKELAKEESEGGKLASAIVNYGPARQRLLQIQKVKESRTGKAHPDLRVMGTATNRLAGASGLNWQGIGAVDKVDQSIFDEERIDDLPETDTINDLNDEIDELIEESVQKDEKVKVGLRHAILTPSVGDWSSFEVVIAASVYDDPQLKADLRAGIDLHSMTTATAHPEALRANYSYEKIVEAYNDESHPDHHKVTGWRKSMKAIVFGIFYFASVQKVAETLGVTEMEGQKVLDRFYNRYHSIGEYRRKIEQRFITCDVESWTRGSAQRMSTEQFDLTGFKRSWKFEKSVAVALWELGCSRSIRSGLSGKVIRTQAKGHQTIDMAITSACLGSAIAIQAACSRQAGNMPVQATGSSINKMLQAVIWERARIPTLSIHDELIAANTVEFDWSTYSSLVTEYVQAAQAVVPMLKFDYKQTERWSDK